MSLELLVGIIIPNSDRTQSTLALELAAMLGVPCIHLDRLYWQPGWHEPRPEDFRSRVFAALEQDPRGWVVDGRYYRLLGSKVTEEATDVICELQYAGPGPIHSQSGLHLLPGLDPPLILYFPRLVYRTIQRLLRLAPPCSPGCEETASQVFFSRESMIWWYVVTLIPFHQLCWSPLAATSSLSTEMPNSFPHVVASPTI